MAYYLELNSTFRNRNIWPNPAEFEIDISSSGPSSKNAVDPVCESIPLQCWTSHLFDTQNPGPVIQGVVSNPNIGYATSNNVIIITTPLNTLQTVDNYYVNAVWNNITNPTQYSRISEYKYLGTNGVNDIGKFTLKTNVTVTIGDVCNISDATDILLNLLFIPNGSNLENAYTTFVIYNESLNQFRNINEYFEDTGLIQIDSPPLVGWLDTHNYCLRQNPPGLVSPANVGSTTTNIVLGIPAQPVDDIYNGWFIRIPQTIYDGANIPPEGEFRRIVAYNGTTLTATVSPPFSAPTIGFIVELLQFSYDNFSSASYRGPILNDQISRVKLNKLILPNVYLKSQKGGKTSFLPYVYVELSNINNPLSNLLISNNPNSTRALFTATIPNISNLHTAPFVILTGDDMEQLIRFKIDITHKLKIFLPNGDLFLTMSSDTTNPYPPNEKLQIRALFSVNTEAKTCCSKIIYNSDQRKM